MQAFQDLAAPPAAGTRPETLAELAGSDWLVDFDEPDDFAAANVKAKADWSVQVHVFPLSG